VAREFSKVGVVGLGTMGAGIAEVLARSGIDVVGVEVDEAGVTRARQSLEHSTGRAVTRGKLTEEESAAVLGRIAFTTSRDELADVQMIIEAIPERLGAKRELLAQLDRICPADAVLATNTSSLSVT